MKALYDCYSRLLIDNHITDQLPHYMSRFDPAEYVRMVKLAGVESAMVYACDHNGNCYYPTRSGHMHAGLKGRDVFGETVAGLRREDILPVAYYTVIYHNDSAHTHPEWRMRDAAGCERSGRYRFSCPNHPEYRTFCRTQIGELLDYPLGALFIDMTFWPMVCHCGACREHYGRPFPERIDWRDPEWLAFQRFRERSMADFAAELRESVRQSRPELPVTFQFSPVLHGWHFGQSEELAAQADYASGDFYGGKLQQRLGVKVFAAYSRRQPYEFMTSRCESLHDHTSTKSDGELFLHAVTTLFNGGAYFFIDAINPDGTLEESFYRRLHGIVRRLEPFRRAVARHRPEPAGTTGLYFSMVNGVDDSQNGLPLKELGRQSGNMAVHRNVMLDELLGTALALNRLHLPYRVVTDRDGDLSGFDTIIVNRAVFLSAAETDRLLRFVEAGGTLLATGATSLFQPDGTTDGNFQLADVFGVDYTGEDTGRIHYLKTPEGLVSAEASAPLVRSRAGAVVLGTAVLPDFPVDDPDHYASIHSNPPGRDTGCAGLVEHCYGLGKCLYLYAALAAERRHSQQQLLRGLIASCTTPLVLSSRNLPESAEVTLTRSRDGRFLLLGIINYQDELPNIPLADLSLTVGLPLPRRIVRVSDGREIEIVHRDGGLTLRLDRLVDAELFEIELQP